MSRNEEERLAKREAKRRAKEISKRVPKGYAFAEAVLIIVALFGFFSNILVGVVALGFCVVVGYLGKQEARRRIAEDMERKTND